MPGQISVTVRLFASMKEAAGTDHIELSLTSGTPAGAVWGHLPDAVQELGLPKATRYAINRQWTLPGAVLRDGDEVALILPVSGG
ncbi:MAG: MoaD/ThiS family protein [Thermoleophilia bacterium]|nr:MoaD/ThiS family protein [Thermoleophilia bacterium]MDH3724217.1 MoaD/ThiS family protein [Thermoleophilia bacterium]